MSIDEVIDETLAHLKAKYIIDDLDVESVEKEEIRIALKLRENSEDGDLN